MIKIYKLLVIISVILWAAAGIAEEWGELKSEHFIVYFSQDQNPEFAKEVLDKAEIYYRKIALELGYPRYSEFWIWDNRVKIYIYPDHTSFLKVAGQPEWSQGMADYRKKQILSFAWSSGFLESLLPHEMAHLIFRDFVGFKGQIPLWLDEGVAQWAEDMKRQAMRARIKQLYEEDTLLTIEDMMKLDIRTMKEKNRTYVRSTRTKTGETASIVLGTENLVDLYYLQAVSVVDFLIERYSSDNFAVFCRQLRDGKSLEEALRFAYPTHIQDLNDLENKWRRYVAE